MALKPAENSVNRQPRSFSIALAALGALLGVSPWVGAAPEAASARPTAVVEARALSDLEQLLEALSERRVILIGEHHDRYENHLDQLAIIRGLHARGKALVIGLEAFQQPFQQVLDDYVAGIIDEPEMLRRSEYFERWRFDYRLYRPILRFARERGIPLVALNLEEELTRRVGEVGIAGLSAAERARLPAEIVRDDPAYRARIKAVFDHHPFGETRDFERFLEVQLLWDEGMAARAAEALKAHPERTLVVLAGVGHVEYGQGIAQRLLRRVQVPSAILIDGRERALESGAADYFLFPERVELPPMARLGVRLDSGPGATGTRIEDFVDGSGAKAAGLAKGDRLRRIADQPIETYADIRIALLDRAPGERVSVEVERARLFGKPRCKTVEVELH